MEPRGIAAAVNTNPMVFEELATSLATLASYARGDMDAPVKDMEHLYERALKEPPSYSEITSITGHSLQTLDRQRGRGAWLLMSTQDLQVYGVHTRVWHKVGNKYSAPILDQIARVTGKQSQLTPDAMQKLGVELALIDVVGVKDDAIWLVQVVSNDNMIESALSRVLKGAELFRDTVYRDAVIDGKELSSLAAAEKQMRLAFPDTDVATLVLVLSAKGPDFELYQVKLPAKCPQSLTLSQDWIVQNSISYADRIRENRDALFTLPHPLDNELFRGMPPCRGGRTLGMLASAVTRQLYSAKLKTWERKDFIAMLREDFDYEVEKDKVRHDLDDRLVAQGFFRKWGSKYYVAMKGVVRYQYCLAKFTSVGSSQFNLDQIIAQRDKIIAKFGCLQ